MSQHQVQKHLPEWLAALGLASLVMLAALATSACTYAIDLTSLRTMVERLLQTPVRVSMTSPEANLLSKEPRTAAQSIASTQNSSLFDNHPPFSSIRPPVDTLTIHEPAPGIMSQPAPTETSAAPRDALMMMERDMANEAPLVPPPTVTRKSGPMHPHLPQPNLTNIYQTGREGANGAGRPGGQLFRIPENMPPENMARLDPVQFSDPFLGSKRDIETDTLTLRQPVIDGAPERVYPSLDKEVSATFDVYREPESGERFFRLQIRVRDDATIGNIPKDVLYLLDVSRSIRGDELQVMREAVVADILALPKDTRWNCAVFSETSSFFSKDFLPASEGPARAEQLRGFLVRNKDESATNVFRMTSHMLESLPRNPRPVVVFLISDGVANAGAHDITSLVSEFRRVRRDAFSIFPFNAGEGGDAFLLELLAYRSRGMAAASPGLENASEALHAFGQQFAQPVLTAVMANYTNLIAEEVYPQVLPDLYRDTPVTICGRCRKGEMISMRVAGYTAEGPREFFFRASIPEGDDTHPEIARLWAQGKANALMAALADTPEDASLRAKILALAATYQLDSVTAMLTKKTFLEKIKSAVTGTN